jgi:hypothetical protein
MIHPVAAIRQTADAEGDVFSEKASAFVDALISGVASGHATSGLWIEAAEATARLVGIIWEPSRSTGIDGSTQG